MDLPKAMSLLDICEKLKVDQINQDWLMHEFGWTCDESNGLPWIIAQIHHGEYDLAGMHFKEVMYLDKYLIKRRKQNYFSCLRFCEMHAIGIVHSCRHSTANPFLFSG